MLTCGECFETWSGRHCRLTAWAGCDEGLPQFERVRRRCEYVDEGR